MGKVLITDTILRDAHQSQAATRMRLEEMLPVADKLDKIGYYSLECWGGATFDSCMRFLNEDPWERLRALRKAMPNTKLQMLFRGQNILGYKHYADDVVDEFVKKSIENGIDIIRIFDALNDIDNVKESIRLINELGGIADAAVCYTVDPKEEAPAEAPKKKGFFSSLFGKKEEAPAAPKKIFTDEYFVNLAVEMERLGAKIITLKDMAGLVNPSRAASIIGKLKAAVKVPVDFHTHCTPGYGLASSLMAILNGVDILDTNIWWFGEGSAAPAIELVYVFCKKLGIEVDVNMEKVGEIRERLEGIRRNLADFDLNKDKFPKKFDPLKDTLPAEVDALFDKAIAAAKAGNEDELLEACHAIEAHFGFPKPNLLVKEAEVPGGMYSNMVAQLKALQASDLLADAMRLIPKVRRDAGLVPLVTPTSQIVGSQAVLLAMDRRKGNPDYTQANNQFISLVKGEYGHTPVAIDPAFREKITGDPTEKPYDVSSYKKPANPEVADLGGVPLASNSEEYLLLELLPNVANKFLRNRREEEYKAKQPAEAPKAEEAKPEVKAEPAKAAPAAKAPAKKPTAKKTSRAARKKAAAKK